LVFVPPGKISLKGPGHADASVELYLNTLSIYVGG